MKNHSQLQKELDNSKTKTCIDIPGERVIIFVTDKHVLICDKAEKRNQLLIPYAEFIKRWETYKADHDERAETEEIGEVDSTATESDN